MTTQEIAEKTRTAKGSDSRSAVIQLRHEFASRYAQHVSSAASPIRSIAKMTQEIEAECEKQKISPKIMRQEIVNRTIGDINPRYIVEHDAKYDYRAIADLLGLAFPQERINGYVSAGKVYQKLRRQMETYERALIKSGWDIHMYDIAGVGNPILREWIAEDQMKQWNLKFDTDQVLLSTGSLDGIDKTLRGLRAVKWPGPTGSAAMLFPAPSFGVPEWQAKMHGYEVIRLRTEESAQYKLTAEQLSDFLSEHPSIRAVYLTISNNPTAYSYTCDELQSLLQAMRAFPNTLILADMAYIGTGDIAKDKERMRAFAEQPQLDQIIFFWSMSKAFTMTGDRFGYICVGNPEIAQAISVSWVNGIAALPAEWQLRFMAFYQHIQKHPEIREMIASFYALRRRALEKQLRELNAKEGLFAELLSGDETTIYNWSRLNKGESVFTLFEKTGIAGVPGSAFGYSDDHIRLSVGIHPVPGWEDTAL